MSYRPHVPISSETVRSFRVLAASEGKSLNKLIGELLVMGYQTKTGSTVANSL